MDIEIDRWIVCVQGFLSSGTQLGGIVKIQDEIHRRCSGPKTRVLLKHWSDSPAAIADRIMQRRPVGHPPRIVLIGHSYGGCTINETAKELDYRGIDVDYLLFLEAVWRPFRWLPSLLSLLPFWGINVPGNVGMVYSWRQKTNWPRGHRVITQKRTIRRDFWVDAKHQFVDDLPQIKDKALQLSCPGRNA